MDEIEAVSDSRLENWFENFQDGKLVQTPRIGNSILHDGCGRYAIIECKVCGMR